MAYLRAEIDAQRRRPQRIAPAPGTNLDGLSDRPTPQSRARNASAFARLGKCPEILSWSLYIRNDRSASLLVKRTRVSTRSQAAKGRTPTPEPYFRLSTHGVARRSRAD